MVKVPELAFEIIRTEGIASFAKKAFFFVVGHFICVFLYPLFWLMNIRFLPLNYAAVGHLAGELDCFIKEGILGLRPRYKPLALLPQKNVANPHLVTYWKKYVPVISNSIIFSLLWSAIRRNRLISYNIEKYLSDHFAGLQCPPIQKLYGNRPPLLTLTDFDRERGWTTLQKLGIPENAWFVCVHCRENGYPHQKGKFLLRNNNINHYFLAMQEIVRRGGWVIRVGDPTMKPIPNMEKVFDYAHMDIKSDWMDVFLCASCKFLLGSGSGLVNLASVFGVRSVITNSAGPFAEVLSYWPGDIAIPKLIWSSKEERYLSFREILSSPVGEFYEDREFMAHDLRLIENLPEDIRDVAVEMLDCLEGKLKYSEEDERLQMQFRSLRDPVRYSYGAISRVGKNFLTKYENLGSKERREDVCGVMRPIQ